MNQETMMRRVSTLDYSQHVHGEIYVERGPALYRSSVSVAPCSVLNLYVATC